MARSRVTRFLLLAMLLLPLILMMIRPAAGEEAGPEHEGSGVITLEGRHPADGGVVHYVVRVTWAGDGHPAEGAGVTATLVDAFGNPLSSVPLDAVDADGRYAGNITFPGEGLWTVRITSAVPAGSLDVVEQLPVSVPLDLPPFTLIELPAPPAAP